MLDVKQAVARAGKALHSFYKGMGTVGGIRLEEVELSEDENFWLITLSFIELDPEDDPADPNFFRALVSENDRRYKIFKIKASTGKVLSMKIRQV